MAYRVAISERHRQVVLPYHKALDIVFNGTAVKFEFEGKPKLAIPHNLDTTRWLRNVKFDVPSPMNYQYDWPGQEPFASQRHTAAELAANDRYYVLSDMGTGKTRSVLYAFDYLKQIGKANKMLVVAPLSTLNTVWEHEIFRYFPHLTTRSLYGAKKKRIKLLEDDADIYIVNHDGVNVILDDLVLRDDIDVIAFDELSTYRNARTARWKGAERLSRGKPFVWGLTGTPTPNAPTDAYGQARLIRPASVPRFFNQFRNETMTQITQFKWAAKPGANDVVYEIMQPSVRYQRADCVDLPPTTYSTRQVALADSSQLMKAYSQMKTTYQADFAKDGKATAMNAGIQTSKLLQISLGSVYTDNGVARFKSPERLAVLDEIVEQTAHKMIVFVDFKHALADIAGHLTDAGHVVETVSGDVTKKARDIIFRKFQSAHDNLRIIVAHPKTMSHGLTLTEADTIVWFGPPSGLETYLQANARIARPGQVHNTHIIHIQGTKIEELVYKRLFRKEKVQDALLDLFAT